MAENPWFPFYVGDYMRDTARLSTEEHGAYVLLLIDYWSRGAPPDDDKTLSKICKCSLPKWNRKIKAVIKPFFIVEDGRWKHKRVEKELEETNKIKNSNSNKARKAADARWAKQHASSMPQPDNPDAPSMRQALLGDAQPQPPSQSQESTLVFVGGGNKENGERTALGNFDFVSDDGTIVIFAEEFERLQADLPGLTSVRALVRNACRSWLLTIDPDQRKRALMSWLRKTNEVKLAKKRVSEANGTARPEAEKKAAYERDRERERQAQIALQYRRRRKPHEANEAGELPRSQPDRSD